MSSNEEYRPRSESITEGLRRSKRISGSDKQISPSKVAKKSDETSTKKSSTNPKSTPKLKPKRGRPSKTKESSNSFNGSYLTPAELQQLFVKFQKDGHFHVNPPTFSPPPFVVSRTIDGKSVTTKIECYEPFSAQRTKSDVFGKTSDKTSLTFFTPLTVDAPESLIPPNTNPGQSISAKDKSTNVNPNQFVLPKDKNCEQNLPDNCAQNTQNSLPNSNIHSGAGNGFSDNSAGPNIRSKSSAAGNFEPNVFERTSGPIDFSYINSTRQTLPVRQNTMFKTPSSNTFIPANQSAQETRNNSNSSGFNFPGKAHYKNLSGGDQAMRNSRRNATENQRTNLDAHILTNPYDYSNFNGAKIRSPFYQHRQTNAHNLTVPLQRSTFSTQNSTLPLQSSNFPLQNSNVPLQNSNLALQSSNFPLQKNSLPQNLFNLSGKWNAANASAISNNEVIFLGENANSYVSLQNKNSGYHSSYTHWTNNELSPNSYISATIPPYYNCYNESNAQARCETSTRPQIDDQSCMESLINSWFQNDQPVKDLCGTHGNVTKNDSNITTITISDNIESIEESVSDVQGLEDVQSSELYPTVSSNSYDDDISYDNYIEGDMSYNNGNLEQATQENKCSLRLPSIMTIKTDMRSWYNGSNHYSENNDQSNDAGRSGLNSFEMVDSSDCYIIEEPSKS